MPSNPQTNSENLYVGYAESQFVPQLDDFIVESHVPKVFRAAYHHHASIEVNFLTGCDMEYSFSGRSVIVTQNQLTIFWGAVPHGVTRIIGRGKIVNVYISLALLLKWGLPTSFTETIIGGAVLAADQTTTRDRRAFKQWVDEFRNGSAPWRKLVLGEIEMRLRRMALEGPTVLLPKSAVTEIDVQGTAAMRHIDKMLRFIAENFAAPISVVDVANHVGLSPSYAMSLFQKTVGIPIKQHVILIRLSHAQMLLANSDLKVLSIAMDCGFRSLSTFYEAFQSQLGKSPAAFRREIRN